MGGPPVPEHVLAAARRHLESVRPPPGTRWRYPRGERVEGGWFFPYQIERHPPLRRRPPAFGYFPGYLVGDNGSVRDVEERGLRELFTPNPNRR